MSAKKRVMSIRNLESIPGLVTLFSHNADGDLTGVSITADDGFYLRVNYTDVLKKFPWRFADPSPLPAKCKAHHFTLRHMIHGALNWMDIAKEKANV